MMQQQLLMMRRIQQQQQQGRGGAVSKMGKATLSSLSLSYSASSSRQYRMHNLLPLLLFSCIFLFASSCQGHDHHHHHYHQQQQQHENEEDMIQQQQRHLRNRQLLDSGADVDADATATETDTTTMSSALFGGGGGGVFGDNDRTTCGTAAATEADRQARDMAVRAQRARIEALAAVTTTTTDTESTIMDPQGPYVVPVCHHIMAGKNNHNDMTDADLQSQMDALNKAFSATSCCDTNQFWCVGPTHCSINTKFSFGYAVLNSDKFVVIDATPLTTITTDACVIRNTNRHYANPDRLGLITRLMKRKLRKGDGRVLNIYWTSPHYQGAATFPWEYDKSKKQDGVVLDVTKRKDNTVWEGDVLVHEVGHWLGLYHTFENGCSQRSDGIDDTPAERGPFRGCGTDVGRDTCSGDLQPDPVHNFMDFSADLCRYAFTSDQAFVMQAAYNYYRLGNQIRDYDIIVLQEDVNSALITMIPGQRQLYTFAARQDVECVWDAGEGAVRLYYRWNKPPRFNILFDRNRFRTQISGTFDVKHREGEEVEKILYIGVTPRGTVNHVTDFFLRCTFPKTI